MDYLSEGKKCLTCEYWLGNGRVMFGNFEPFRQASGKCMCKGSNNPHYYNGDILSADDVCGFWEKHPQLLRAGNISRDISTNDKAHEERIEKSGDITEKDIRTFEYLNSMYKNKCILCKHWGANWGFSEIFHFLMPARDNRSGRCSKINGNYSYDQRCELWEIHPIVLLTKEKIAQKKTARQAQLDNQHIQGKENQKKIEDESVATVKGLHNEVAQGDAKALYELGRLYLFGHYGVIKDTMKGNELIEKAAERGYEKAKDYLKQQQWAKQGLCRNCGGKLKGLFTKKCKSCG